MTRIILTALLALLLLPPPTTAAGAANLAPFEGPPPRIERAALMQPIARTLTVLSTSYCTGATTATGAPVGVGTVAVDPSIIPLGSHLYVQGYGNAVADDTGGAIQGYRIDVYYPPKDFCLRSVDWGRRTVAVEIFGKPYLSHAVPERLRQVGIRYVREGRAG